MGQTAAEVEEQLVAEVRTLLAKDDITAQDNFFERGGHSILAAQLLNRMEPVLGYRAALRHVFEAEDLRELADVLWAGKASSEPTAVGAPGEAGPRDGG